MDRAFYFYPAIIYIETCFYFVIFISKQRAIETVSALVHGLPKKNGLVPIFINANTGQFRSSATITFGARGDSYYEYLLKQWVQTGKTQNVLVLYTCMNKSVIFY